MSGGVVVKDRTKALLLLAGSRYDVYAPGPKGSKFKKGAGKKQSASHYEPCVDCGGHWNTSESGKTYGYSKGTGIVRDRFKREYPCSTCGGYLNEDGTIEKGKGVIGVDRYTRRQVGTDKTHTPLAKHRWPCNVCMGLDPTAKRGTGFDQKRKEPCRACDGTGTREADPDILRDVKPAGQSLEALDEWTRMMTQREEAGSYKEYDQCVAELARRSEHLHKVFHRVYVLKAASPGLLHPTEARSLELAVAKLLSWMPKEIIVPREIVAAEHLPKQAYAKGKHAPKAMVASRDREIRKRRGDGAKIEELMAEFNLAKSQVYEIVADVAA